MPPSVAIGLADDPDTSRAFSSAAEDAAAGLTGECSLCVVAAGPNHLDQPEVLLEKVHARLAPSALIGCGAGGVIGGGQEVESASAAVVWALSAPGAEIKPMSLTSEPLDGGLALGGLPEDPADLGGAIIVLADPTSFAADALLAHLNEVRPALPVIGGLASAASPHSGSLFLGDDVLDRGAVACALSGIEVLPCVSQGAAPVGPEMTVTGAERNLITELASKPALDRVREVIEDLDRHEQALAAGGLLLGIVIDENQPEYPRGDFLVRPIVGVDPATGAVAAGVNVRVGQTVRLHVRDADLASEDLRDALRMRALALGDAGAAGTLVFSCNGRGTNMFGDPGHDASLLADVLGAPAGGFFAAGEIGPVGGRNFLHGFTATMAVFPNE